MGVATYDFTRESRFQQRITPTVNAPEFAHQYRYRIYTENVHIRAIYRLCDKSLTGYTVCLTRGVWQKTHEASLYVEYIGDQCDTTIKALAESIKVRNAQQAVLVTREPIESILV